MIRDTSRYDYSSLASLALIQGLAAVNVVGFVVVVVVVARSD